MSYFNIDSKEKRLCTSCKELHPVFYKKYSSGTRLVMVCSKSSPVTRQVKFEPNLDIPTLRG